MNNLLHLPDTVQFANGSQIVHSYNALGRRLATTYYTRKVATAVPVGTTLAPSVNLSDYNVLNYAYNDNMVYIDYNNRGLWQLEYVHTPVGDVRYYGPEEHYPFYYIRDYLGNVREVWVHPWLNHSEYVQRTQYYPSGLPWNEGYSPSEQPYKYGGKEFVEMHGLDEYDSAARWYYHSIMRTTTMDPHCEQYYDTSPYVWCGNNPVNNVDPTGMDWYKNEEQQILWTECKNQKELDENQIIGKYLGVAHVVFEGSRDEKLGYKNNEYGYIDGEGAITANVTVYGPRNSDDIHDLIGYTMTSDAEKFGAIDEGLYPANYDVIGKRGNLQSHWVLNNRGAIRMMDGKENPYAQYQKDANGEGYKTGIFIHATNASGKATGNVSAGCLLIAPLDFITFNSIMHNVKQFTVQVSRKVTIYKTNQQNSTSLIPYTYLKID